MKNNEDLYDNIYMTPCFYRNESIAGLQPPQILYTHSVIQNEVCN